MSTYLELCQEMAREVGIPGSGPTTVSGQTGELGDIVRYIRDADLDIKRRWHDWNFMWASTTNTTSVGNRTLTSSNPSDLGYWNVDKIVYNYNSDDFVFLEYCEWEEYALKYKFGTVDNDEPFLFTIRPDRVIEVYPPAAQSKSVYLEYWKKPIAMTTDSDESIVPEEFHRLIIVRAKIYYAEHEDAPEVLVASTAEFEDLMDNLESGYGRKQSMRRMHRASGLPRVEVI